MKRILSLLLVLVATAAAQSGKSNEQKPGLLSRAELKQLVPTNVFFAGQSAPSQLRNSAGVRTSDGKIVMSFLVDTSGYASDVAEKYQGYLLAEKAITVEGKSLPAGAYGIGFPADGNFHVMDIGNHDVLSVAAHTDSEKRRPVPLQITESNGGYRLYFGRHYVEFKTE